nr:MAG TPA: hypothetical protein [Caudoviricetes sp.]
MHTNRCNRQKHLYMVKYKNKVLYIDYRVSNKT